MEKLKKVSSNFDSGLKNIKTLSELKDFRNEFLSKNGSITALMQNIKDLSIEEKKTFGAEVNKLKNYAEDKVSSLEKEFEDIKIKQTLKNELLDVTIPTREIEEGLVHPMTRVKQELQDIFQSMGFSIAEGPEIEDDWHNFEALNFPPNHPARQMQDTFFMPDGEDGAKYVLRTHTTSVQARELSRGKPPFKMISIGKTYRNESDATHVPMFSQVDAFYVDIGITMANLKATVSTFLQKFFEIENAPLRFRPAFFPFTSPSIEVDMKCTKDGGKIIKFGEGNDWVELGGAGMIHPNVLKNCGLNSDEYQGFAWGFGLERMAMLKYGISDARQLYEGDLRFLRHYSFKFFE